MGSVEASKWLRIGEFALLSGVSVKTVRYYAACKLVLPAYVDPSTSYRFYRSDQVLILKRIRALRRLGLGIAELQAWLGSPAGSFERLRLLENLRCRIQLHLAADRERLDLLQIVLDNELRDPAPSLPDAPAERVIPRVAAYTIRSRRPCTSHAIYEMFELAESHVARHAARANSPPFLLLHDSKYGERHRDVEVCIPILKQSLAATGGKLIEGAKRAACRRFAGPYDQGTAVVEGIQRWIGSSGARAAGPLREVYWRYGADQYDYSIPKAQLARRSVDYLTEIQIPIARDRQ